jgi:hypothetical protein
MANDMTDQELADAIQKAIARATNLTTVAVKRACSMAEKSSLAEPVVPPLSRALGHLWAAHGDTTEAASAMPEIVPMFGDK